MCVVIGHLDMSICVSLNEKERDREREREGEIEKERERDVSDLKYSRIPSRLDQSGTTINPTLPSQQISPP